MTPTPPPASDAALGDPRVFRMTRAGSGAFGRWTLDDAGLPAYLYQMDQYTDGRARYPNTEWPNRRDHWHQIGNHRVNALASNDGTVQLYLCDRGGVFPNRFDARDFETSGGPPLSLLDRLDGILRGLARLVTLAFPILRSWRRRLRAAWYHFRARGIDRVRRGGLTPRGILPDELIEPMGALDRSDRDEAPIPYAYAGGFSYIHAGDETWATAFRYRPRRAKTRRLFGMGYYETEMTYRNIRHTRRVYAPLRDDSTLDDDPTLLIDAHLENLDSKPVDLRYYEYWDVNVHQLKLQWRRSSPFAAPGDAERRSLNEQFTPSIGWDDTWQALRFHQAPKKQLTADAPDPISEVDQAPADIFLADLTGQASAQYTDKAAFFGAGGATQPDAVRARREGEVGGAANDAPMPYCMVLRRDLRIEPGESVKLRYAYGAARPGQTLDFLRRYRDRDDDPLRKTLDRWKKRLAYFSSGDPVLQREMAWHAYNLQSVTVYNEYYDSHLVPQGSAYLYLHGADGAPRDQALFVLPLTYLNPELARDTLRLIMRLTDAGTGAIPYAFAGHGIQSDAMTFHAKPSDLDLFFLLALSEYLAATGDMAFLSEAVSFYPRHHSSLPPGAQGTSVLDHVRVAVTHLIHAIGIGENGLIKIGDGDWSDSIVLEALPRISLENTIQNGESVPNTQMALYVLPLAAALVESRDAALAKQMRDRLPGLKQAADEQWIDRGQYGWYTRAILRDHLNNPVVWDADRISLESQPWALISGLAAETQKETTLIRSITMLLDDPSEIGAPLYEHGEVWPAVSQLLTWGYTRSRPDLAWRSLNRHMFATHAGVFPDIWYGTWSGPDAILGEDYEKTLRDKLKSSADLKPGGTWCSPFTPMTDFPVMNANPDAMALLGLLRICGVEPAPEGDGLIIAPQAPPERFVLDLPLLRLEVEPQRVAGEYRAVVNGSRVLHVQVPVSAGEIQASVDGQPSRTIPPGARRVALSLVFQAGQAVPFEVHWNS